MDLISTKILVAVLFGLLRFFFGILPLKLYKLLLIWEGQDEDHRHFINERRHQQVTCALALCESFGGGVLFATCFLHMMPEVWKSVEVLKQYGNLQTDYPLSQMTVSLGFFLVYFVEELSHWFLTKVPDQVCDKKNDNPARLVSPLSLSSNNKVSPLNQENDVYIIQDDMFKEKEALESVPISDNASLSSEVVKENKKNEEMNKEIDEIEEEMEIQARTTQQIMRYVLIVSALSLHSIFEGLAIGLQHSVPNIWYLFTAVSIHSATILFYIGLELLLKKTKLRTLLANVIILAITSPIGVVLGLIITLRANMDTRVKSTAVVVLEGLSAGTLLYITFFEVLNREKERRVYRVRRCLCILAGFGLMALLQCTEMYIE